MVGTFVLSVTDLLKIMRHGAVVTCIVTSNTAAHLCACAASGVTQSKHRHQIKGSFVVVNTLTLNKTFFANKKVLSVSLCREDLSHSSGVLSILSRKGFFNTPMYSELLFTLVRAEYRVKKKRIDLMSTMLLRHVKNASV